MTNGENGTTNVEIGLDEGETTTHLDNVAFTNAEIYEEGDRIGIRSGDGKTSVSVSTADDAPDVVYYKSPTEEKEIATKPGLAKKIATALNTAKGQLSRINTIRVNLSDRGDQFEGDIYVGARRRSRLHKKTRRSKRNGGRRVHRKLRKLTTRRR